MGSGRFPAEGLQHSAYFHNVRFQSDRSGKTARYDGNPFVTDAARYDIEAHMNGGGSWESFAWVGGPGAT